MDYNHTPYAALLECRIEDLGSHCSIYVADNSTLLFEKMKNDIIHWSSRLFDKHREDINNSDINELYTFFGTTDSSPTGFSTDNIKDLINDLILEHGLFLNKTAKRLSIVGKWYHLIEWVNDIWNHIEGDNDYIIVPVEGNLAEFTNGLIEFIEFGQINTNLIDFHEGKWLVTLKSIITMDNYHKRPVSIRKLYELFNEFNKHYVHY